MYVFFSLLFLVSTFLCIFVVLGTGCGNPPGLSNGYVSGTDGNDDGDSTYYACHAGYDGSGDNSIRCQYTSWETLNYNCIIKDCGTPGTISNGDRHIPSTTYSSTVTYSCNTGYYGTGTTTITCQSNGQWSNRNYYCTIYDCSTPPTISNGDRTYSSTHYNSGVSYHCDTGYDGSGSNSITCQHGGTWSSVGYTCTIKDCGTPPPITHATVTTGITTYQAQHTYTCNEGYVESGTDTITCQADGQWSSTNYDCPPFDCGQPVDLKDSTINVPYTTYPENATYVCDLGHYESDPGNMSIMCTPIGWQNFTFWCIPYDCEPPTFELPRAVASWDTTIFRTLNSSTVKYTCNIGYIIDPEEFEDGEVECNHTGQWDEVEFNCIFNYCKNVSKAYKTPSTYPFQSDGLRGQMYLLNDTMYTVECCGVISGWEFKPVETGFIYLMVWRRNENFIPVMVAYNTILIANTSSIVNVTVTDDEKIAVQPFDQIGWYAWEGSPIAYEECDPLLESACPQTNLYYQGIQNIPENYEFDWDNTGNILNNRSYAIKYYFTRNTPLQFLEEEYNVSIPDHMIGNEPFMTFSIVGVDHAERATYTLEPLGDTPQTIYFFIDSYFGTIKVSQPLPKSNETNEFVYNVTAVDGCENYGYTILTIHTYNAPPKFENIPNQIEVNDEDTKGNMNLYDIVVSDPTNDSVCCTLQQTFPSSLNFELVVIGDRMSVMTTKNAYFSASFVDSYFVKFCCQDRNYSTSGILQVKVKGEFQEEVIPLPGWFMTSLMISCIPIFTLMFSSCILLCYLLFGL